VVASTPASLGGVLLQVVDGCLRAECKSRRHHRRATTCRPSRKGRPLQYFGTPCATRTSTSLTRHVLSRRYAVLVVCGGCCRNIVTMGAPDAGNAGRPRKGTASRAASRSMCVSSRGCVCKHVAHYSLMVAARFSTGTAARAPSKILRGPTRTCVHVLVAVISTFLADWQVASTESAPRSTSKP